AYPHWNLIFLPRRFIPTLAKLPAEKGCECWNRTTSGVDLTFAPHLVASSSANVNSLTPLETYICWWSFDSNIRKIAGREGMRMLESDHQWSGFDIRTPSGREFVSECQIPNSTKQTRFTSPLAGEAQAAYGGRSFKGLRSKASAMSHCRCDPGEGLHFIDRREPLVSRKSVRL